MINRDALVWLQQHWSPEYIENDSWVAVSSNGIIAMSGNFESVVDACDSWPPDSIVFAFASFEVWQ